MGLHRAVVERTRQGRDEIDAAAKRLSEASAKAGLTVVAATAIISVMLQEITKWVWQNMIQGLPI